MQVLIALVLIFPTQQKGSVGGKRDTKNLAQASLTLWDDCSVKITVTWMFWKYCSKKSKFIEIIGLIAFPSVAWGFSPPNSSL